MQYGNYFNSLTACNSGTVLSKQPRIDATSMLESEKSRQSDKLLQLMSIIVTIARYHAFGLVGIEHGVS